MTAECTDFLWLANHPDELQRLYSGQWLALVQDQIVCAGPDGPAVYRQARDAYPDAEIVLEVITRDCTDLLSLI